MKKHSIVFMGTPDFAVATLGSLLMNGFNVTCVVTAPDKPAGRGRKLSVSSVKEFAVMSSLPVLQPTNLKDPDFIKVLSDLKPDLFVVVAFRMLPEIVWRIPSLGTINLHASLLPNYRGAAPINHVIINGEQTTGVTTFLIDEKIDTGNILLQEEVPVFPFENAGDLHDKLMKEGAKLVIKTVNGLLNNKLKPLPQSQLIQPGVEISSAPKIFPENCIIDWTKSCENINNLVRGLAPYPASRSAMISTGRETWFKIFETSYEVLTDVPPPGTIVSDNKTFIKVACGDGFVKLLNIQAEGKSRLNPAEFLRGFRLSDHRFRIT